MLQDWKHEKPSHCILGVFLVVDCADNTKLKYLYLAYLTFMAVINRYLFEFGNKPGNASHESKETCMTDKPLNTTSLVLLIY